MNEALGEGVAHVAGRKPSMKSYWLAVGFVGDDYDIAPIGQDWILASPLFGRNF